MPDVLLTTETGAVIETEAGTPVAAYSYLPAQPGLPAYGVDDFVGMFQGLKPFGAVWPREPDTVNYAGDAALMPTYVRSWQSICGLIVDAFPASTVQLLPEWEATLGLPDPCLGAAPTIAQRQQNVVAQLTQDGGQSIPFFIALAASLGFSITITEFKPAVYGDSYGRDYAGNDWAYAWRVTAPALVQTFAAYGQSYYGEYYSSWGSAVLQCVLNSLKPAHTILQFAYTGTAPAAALGPVAATPAPAAASPVIAPVPTPVAPPPLLGEFILGRNILA